MWFPNFTHFKLLAFHLELFSHILKIWWHNKHLLLLFLLLIAILLSWQFHLLFIYRIILSLFRFSAFIHFQDTISSNFNLHQIVNIQVCRYILRVFLIPLKISWACTILKYYHLIIFCLIQKVQISPNPSQVTLQKVHFLLFAFEFANINQPNNEDLIFLIILK